MAVASRPSSSPMAASTQDEPPPAARRRSASGSFHGRVKPLSCHSRIAASYRRSGSGSILTAEAYSSCPSPACGALSRQGQRSPEQPVHDFSTAAQLGHDYLPVDRLGRQGALVPNEVGDVFERHPIGAEQRDKRVPQLPRHPVGTQVCCLRDLPEL